MDYTLDTTYYDDSQSISRTQLFLRIGYNICIYILKQLYM